MGARASAARAAFLQNKMASTPITLGPDTQVHVTISSGVTVAQPDDLGLEMLLRRADGLLYEAKHGGRNRTHSDFAPL